MSSHQGNLSKLAGNWGLLVKSDLGSRWKSTAKATLTGGRLHVCPIHFQRSQDDPWQHHTRLFPLFGCLQAQRETKPKEQRRYGGVKQPSKQHVPQLKNYPAPRKPLGAVTFMNNRELKFTFLDMTPPHTVSSSPQEPAPPLRLLCITLSRSPPTQPPRSNESLPPTLRGFMLPSIPSSSDLGGSSVALPGSSRSLALRFSGARGIRGGFIKRH